MTTKTKLRQSLDESFLRDLDKPTLHGLSYALRHPDTWPEDFVWDYNDCNQCAVGLACNLWFKKYIDELDHKESASFMAKKFSMPYTDSNNIFLGHGDWAYRTVAFVGIPIGKTQIDFKNVTPEMVADEIDLYLKRAEQLSQRTDDRFNEQ